MNNNLINGGIAVRGTDLARKSPFTPRWHDDVSMVSFPLWHHENGPDPYTATLADAITTSIDAFGAAAIASIKSVASRSVMHSDEDTHHTIYGAGGATVVHSDSGVAAVEMSERHSLHVEQIHAGLAEQSAAAAVSPAVPYTSKGLTLAPVSVTDTIHIPAGGAVELTSSYSGTVMFDGATGTLKIDNSSDFHGTIAGQLTTGNMIDFADITAGANAKMTYSGDNSPGTLTVSDGTHTASIDLLGKYVLANFAASSDGHSGTSVVDPPVLPAGVTLKPIDGSQTYYADHGFTNAVNMGWDNPNFFAIGPWESSYNSQTDVNTWAALGWNTAFTDGGLNLSLTASHGISVIDNSGGGKRRRKSYLRRTEHFCTGRLYSA